MIMMSYIKLLCWFSLLSLIGCDNQLSKHGLGIVNIWQRNKLLNPKMPVDGIPVFVRPDINEHGIITFQEGFNEYDMRPIMLDKTTGQVLWSGDDQSVIDWERGNIQKDNVLVINATHAIIGLDYKTGKTLWRNGRIGKHAYGPWLNSIGDYYFITNWEHIIRGRISDGHQEVLYTVPPVNEKLEGIILPSPIPYRAANGDTMLVIQYKEYDDAAYQSKQYVALYNVSQKRQEAFHEVDHLDNGMQWGYGEYHDGYLISYYDKSLVSINPRTGDFRWKLQIPGGIDYEPFAIEGNKLIFTTDNGWIYGLDLDTGKTLWKTEFIGGMAKPFVMDGVVYVTGRAQGHLYAVDLETGKKLLDLRCPETDQDDAVAFTMPVTGANGVIYIDSHASTYAYKVER